MLRLSELQEKKVRSTGVVYALCPEHRERTPSFRVRGGAGFCFGCGHADAVVDDWSVSPDQVPLFPGGT
jgi:DNA primase